MKSLAIFGSTGSIGRQALSVAEFHKEEFSVRVIAANSNADAVSKQIECFHPEYVGMYSHDSAKAIRERFPEITVVSGEEINALAALPEIDTVVNGVSGFAGLAPLLSALNAGKTVALANKESIVCAHHVVDDALNRFGGRILPVDSEQSAIFQCLEAGRREDVKSLILTASGGMFRELLSCFTTMFVQNAASRTLLNKIGFNNVEVAGDTRFDRVADVRNAAKDFPVVERFVSNSKFTLVAGSSWQPDEDIIVPYFNSHPGMKLILAPHEFDKERLDALLVKFKRPVSLYSCASADEMEQCDALVVDCFGILSSLYRYGQVAYVGGGFGAGIHNVNEAAVYGMPVVFGPNHKKFREATDLIACGGGFAIDGDEAFAKVMDKMLSNKAFLEKSGTIADKYIQSHLGATDFVYANIFGKSAGK